MEVHQDQGLVAGLPLNPGCSLSLPVSVMVGRPPGDAFDAVGLQGLLQVEAAAFDTDTDFVIQMAQLQLHYFLAVPAQVRVTYHSAAISSSNVNDIIGRQVTLPLKLAVQPTLQADLTARSSKWMLNKKFCKDDQSIPPLPRPAGPLYSRL
eukprot:gene12262-12400_t